MGRTGDCPGPREETATRRATCPRKHSEAGGARPKCRGEWAANTEKRPLQQPAQPPVRQLLRSVIAKTAPPGTQAAAADRTQRHSTQRDERVTVQGPVKKQQPNGMSHGGMASLVGHEPAIRCPDSTLGAGADGAAAISGDCAGTLPPRWTLARASADSVQGAGTFSTDCVPGTSPSRLLCGPCIHLGEECWVRNHCAWGSTVEDPPTPPHIQTTVTVSYTPIISFQLQPLLVLEGRRGCTPTTAAGVVWDWDRNRGCNCARSGGVGWG